MNILLSLVIGVALMVPLLMLLGWLLDKNQTLGLTAAILFVIAMVVMLYKMDQFINEAQMRLCYEIVTTKKG